MPVRASASTSLFAAEEQLTAQSASKTSAQDNQSERARQNVTKDQLPNEPVLANAEVSRTDQQTKGSTCVQMKVEVMKEETKSVVVARDASSKPAAAVKD